VSTATPLEGNDPTPLRVRLERYYRITRADGEKLDQLEHREASVTRGEHILAHEARNEHFLVMQEGWAYRYLVTKAGARQILEFLVAGDIINPDSAAVKRTDHAICALTTVTIRCIEKERMGSFLRDCPSILAAMWWSNAQEKGLLQAQIVRIGRQNALQRIGHMLLELHCRLLLVGKAAGPNTFALPLTQREIGDALGLSSVHVSRVLMELRKRQLVRLSGNSVELLEPEELAEACDYNSRHLHLDSRLADSFWS
jgi:CRP-like cAMP-binding protein